MYNTDVIPHSTTRWRQYLTISGKNQNFLSDNWGEDNGWWRTKFSLRLRSCLCHLHEQNKTIWGLWSEIKTLCETGTLDILHSCPSCREFHSRCAWWLLSRQTGLTSVFLWLLVPHASLKSCSASCCYYCCMPIAERDGDSQEAHVLPIKAIEHKVSWPEAKSI